MAGPRLHGVCIYMQNKRCHTEYLKSQTFPSTNVHNKYGLPLCIGQPFMNTGAWSHTLFTRIIIIQPHNRMHSILK